MKKYADSSKTDKLDSRKIVAYGLDNWYHLREFDTGQSSYQELKILCQQYSHYMKIRIDSVLALTNIWDATMPGIKNILYGWNFQARKDKLSDFVEKHWHFDLITKREKSNSLIFM